MTEITHMSKLERYHIQECLGEGGMGSVFKAWDTQLQRPVAIKFFHDFNPEDVEQCRRIQQEAVNHATIQHPNVVTLFDHGIDLEKSRPFAVMELVEGETLHAMIQRQRLDLDLFRDVAAQALDGLNAAHKIGMLHRDLKALNIMLSPRIGGNGYRVKLLDFGLSKKLNKPEIQTTDQEEGLLGSIHSMAPEQFDRKPIDQRTDLYALGCIFYFALVGKFPFDGDTPSDIMVAHLRHFVRPLHLRRPDVPKPLSEWVMKFIEKEPANRHRSAWSALEELRALSKFEPKEVERKELVRKALPHLIAIPAITILALVIIAMPLWKSAMSGKPKRSSGGTPAPAMVTSTPIAEETVPGTSAPTGETVQLTAEQAQALAVPLDHEGPYAPSDTPRLGLMVDQEVLVRGIMGDFVPAEEGSEERGLRFQGDDGSLVSVRLTESATDMDEQELRGLKGQEVEVRGYVEKDDAGLRLAVDSWSQIEVVGYPEDADL